MLGDELTPRERVLEHVRGADVVVSMFSDRVDEAFLDAAGSRLRGVCNFAVGVDNFDLEACARRGVLVANTPDAVTEGTANLAWLLIMAVARRLIEADRFARSSEYPKLGPLGMADFLGQDLCGKTLLVVGAGRIGYATALRSLPWAMRVLYVARSAHPDFEQSPLNARRVTLEEGLGEADVISLHTPLTPATRHLIGPEQFEQMKDSAILVNTSRGPVIDEQALADALEQGKLYGAGLDVYEQEPEIHVGLVDRTDVVLTPHIGSAEVRFREMMTRMVSANAQAMLAGRRPPNLVGA